MVASTSNPFSKYYAEILRTEGLNAFAVADINAVTEATLANYDVVLLGDFTLTPSQVSMFTTWVNGGGNLIAMHPASNLASLLGLTAAERHARQRIPAGEHDDGTWQGHRRPDDSVPRQRQPFRFE